MALGPEVPTKAELAEDTASPSGNNEGLAEPVEAESTPTGDSEGKKKKRILTRRDPRMHKLIWHVVECILLNMIASALDSPVDCWNLAWAEEKLVNAAKARIRRMVEEKKVRTDLAAPSWLKKEWAKGTEQKDQMAHCLQEMNWDKARFPVGPLCS